MLFFFFSSEVAGEVAENEATTEAQLLVTCALNYEVQGCMTDSESTTYPHANNS